MYNLLVSFEATGRTMIQTCMVSSVSRSCEGQSKTVGIL